MKVKAVALALALMTSTSLVSLAQPADKTVWRVGVLDGSSREFAGGEPHVAIHFVVGQDQPRTAWYAFAPVAWAGKPPDPDRKSTRLNSSHQIISYAVLCLKKKHHA